MALLIAHLRLLFLDQVTQGPEVEVEVFVCEAELVFELLHPLGELHICLSEPFDLVVGQRAALDPAEVFLPDAFGVLLYRTVRSRSRPLSARRRSSVVSSAYPPLSSILNTNADSSGRPHAGGSQQRFLGIGGVLVHAA